MRITNNYVLRKIEDKKILNLMDSYLYRDDIRKIYKQWNFWSPEVERFGTDTEMGYDYKMIFIGKVLSAVAMVEPYAQIEFYLNKYCEGNPSALLSFVLENVKWSVPKGFGKKLFEGDLLSEGKEEKNWIEEEQEQEKDKKQILLEKVQKEIIEEYPAFKEVFYKKYRDNIASMVFNLNGNANDSELLERLIEDEMIEDFSNFKIKQIENLLKNS